MVSKFTRARSLTSWLSQRAWSRAGAVAEVLATGPTRRVLAYTTRVVLFLLGAVLIAASVAVLLWNQLGPGPLDVFIGAVRTRTGLPLAPAVWLTFGVMTLAAWLLGRRPGVGTIVAPFVIGSVMQVMVSGLDHFAVPGSLVLRFTAQLGAIAGIGVGAGALIVSGLGAGTGELLAAAASDRSGHPEPRVRMAFELSWLALGTLLGGPIGYGTVLVALLVGPSVAAGYRLVDTMASRLRHQVASTRSTLVAFAP
jgi:uncharacterized membrane protein YczE